jgi:hypothetical protein
LRLISSRLISVCSLLLLLFVVAVGQTSSSSEASRLLPKNIGAFRAQGTRPLSSLPQGIAPEDFGVRDAAEGTYVSPKGEKLEVALVRTQTQAGAYALLTEVASQMRSAAPNDVTKAGNVGIAGVATPDRVAFYKGPVFVSITGKAAEKGENSLIAFAQSYAQTLEDAENAIPVLVKHLPEWEVAQDRAVYAVSLPALQDAVGNEAVLDALNFAEGTEAITASYDTSQLVIVEYTTPQIAESNDARITERIKQLRESGQPVPSAYRRVGNYSVFVFNAPDETASAQLIDSVKYEQRIQWLGADPFAFEGAAQQHTQKAVSLILGIAKTIGFFLALCLGAGGIVGGIAFLHRRAQASAAAEAYSDAGGMLRLNLDEMTPQTDPARLLDSGEGKTAIGS